MVPLEARVIGMWREEHLVEMVVEMKLREGRVLNRTLARGLLLIKMFR